MPDDSHLDENGFVVLDTDARAMEIARCQLCDADGYLNGSTVCDHQDHQADTVHGRAEAARVLAEIAARIAERRRAPVGGTDTGYTPLSPQRGAESPESPSEPDAMPPVQP